MALIKQGPLTPSSGYTFTSGSFDNLFNNWVSDAQPTIIPNVWPTAIHIDDGPDGTGTNPYARFTTTSLATFTDMFAVCKFGASIPSDANISGVEFLIDNVASGAVDMSNGANQTRFAAMYLTFSGGSNIPIMAGNNVLTPGPTGLLMAHPHTREGTGIFGGSGELWGLGSFITPNDARSGVNHPTFGLAFGIIGPAATVTNYLDNVKMNIYYTLPVSSINNNISLFINGYDTFSGNINLYTQGNLNNSGDITLYTDGLDVSNSGISLYISGPITISGNNNLYTLGHTNIDSGIPLFVYGHEVINSSIQLYIGGALSASSSPFFPLSILGQTGTPASSNISLMIYGNPPGTSITFRGLDLFIRGAALSGTLPLFIGADFPATGLLNLYISGNLPSIRSVISLFIKQTGISSGVPLFIQGKQLTINPGLPYDPSGWIPITGGLSLFIQRLDAGMVNMYIGGLSKSSGNIPLFITSGPTISSGIDLFTKGIANSSVGVMLYSHGASH